MYLLESKVSKLNGMPSRQCYCLLSRWKGGFVKGEGGDLF